MSGVLLLYFRTGPRRALSLKSSDTRVHAPEKRTRLPMDVFGDSTVYSSLSTTGGTSPSDERNKCPCFSLTYIDQEGLAVREQVYRKCMCAQMQKICVRLGVRCTNPPPGPYHEAVVRGERLSYLKWRAGAYVLPCFRPQV